MKASLNTLPFKYCNCFFSPPSPFSESSVYSLNIINSFGCHGVGQAEVSVLENLNYT